MNTLEKALGAATAVIAVIGTVLTVLGVPEAGIIGACVVALCGLYLVAQLLRESRRQKRSLELLREAEKKSRAAIAAARLEGVHARNDVVGQARRIRADLKDQFGKSSRRDSALAEAVGAEAASTRAEITNLVTKEARGTRAALRESASQSTVRLVQAEELLLAQLDARTRQVRRQTVTERTAIIGELAKLEGRVNDALAANVDATTAYQQLTTQKLIAQQDGLRRVVDLVRQGLVDLERTISGVEGRIEALSAHAAESAGREQLEVMFGTLSQQRDDAVRLAGQVTSFVEELKDSLSRLATADALSELDGTVTNVRSSVTDLGSFVTGVKSSVGELEASVDEQLKGAQSRLGLLTENARGLSEQVLGIGDKIAALENKHGQFIHPSMVEIGERLSTLRNLEPATDPLQATDLGVVVASHRAALGHLRQMLHEVRSSETLAADEKERWMAALYSELGMQDVAQEHVLDVEDFEIGVSFRAQMVRLMHLKENFASQGCEISPRENDKMRDRAFAEALGVPTPTLLFRDLLAEEVEVTPNSIIKPVVGESSRGVFFVQPDGNLLSLKTRNVYSRFEEAAAEYSRWYRDAPEPRWIGESAVLDGDGNPARDIKVFAFYGEVGMYREIVRVGGAAPSPITATYDADGQRIMYRDSDDPKRAVAIPHEVGEMAKRISSSSPLPFLRVDFLIGDDGPVLGEITPHPGGIYAGDASDQLDRVLGKMFLEADARLTIDLLRGKDFGMYLNAYEVEVGSAGPKS